MYELEPVSFSISEIEIIAKNYGGRSPRFEDRLAVAFCIAFIAHNMRTTKTYIKVSAFRGELEMAASRMTGQKLYIGKPHILIAMKRLGFSIREFDDTPYFRVKAALILPRRGKDIFSPRKFKTPFFFSETTLMQLDQERLSLA